MQKDEKLEGEVKMCVSSIWQDILFGVYVI